MTDLIKILFFCFVGALIAYSGISHKISTPIGLLHLVACLGCFGFSFDLLLDKVGNPK